VTLAAALLFLAAQAAPDEDLRRLEAFERELRSLADRIRPAFVFFGNGSGVCISPDGWVLTNFHVSGDRDGQRVRLAGGRVFVADVVGWEPHGDIALCRLRDARDLPYLELGDSDRLVVGQPVVALGNPFLVGRGSWEPTLTYGVVSALHRYMDNPGYFDAIQTDAAINPGNSGGPLLTLDGKVVGINGRIDIRRFMSRVNTGIGYAIPSNQIHRYLPALREGGRVDEGYVEGLTIGECGDPRYENVGRYGDGVFVAGVTADTPAEAAGFEVGDIIFEVEGHRVYNANRFHGVVSGRPPGETVRFSVRRGGERKELKVFLGDPERVRTRAFFSGLGFAPARGDGGVRVESVDPSGAAARAGLRPGDLIRSAGGRPVRTPDDLREAFRAARPEGSVKLSILRRGREAELSLPLEGVREE
jgi:serine protease Do